MKRIQLPAAVFAAALMLFALGLNGCSDLALDTSAAESGGGSPAADIPAGFGSLTVRFSQGAARTVVPQVELSGLFLSYEFSKDGAAKTTAQVDGTNQGTPIVLEPGSYTLSVTAFVDSARTQSAASGETGPFTITEGQKATVAITLKPVASGGTGSLELTLTYPAGAAVETLTLTRIAGETAINLNDPPLTPSGDPLTGTVARDNIPAGYYRLQALLTMGEKAAGKTEVVHIYQNLTARAEYVFEEKHFTAALTGGPTAEIEFYEGEGDFYPVSDEGNTPENWTLTAKGQSPVYFAVYKEAAQRITSTDQAVSVVTSGTPGGLEASEELAVVTVNTGDLPFDGGELSFTLDVAEDGKTPRSVALALTVDPYKTGAAVFRHTPGGLERQEGDFDGLVNAFKWVENNAQSDTEYTIRVEKDETGLPHLIAGLNSKNGAENVSLRLRGTEEGPWKLEPQEAAGGDPLTPEVNENNTGGFFGFIVVGATVDYGSEPRRTLIIGKNITVRGGTPSSKTGVWSSVLYAGSNATLVLEPGSAVTDSSNTAASGVIRLNSKNNTPTASGKVRILGCSISGCVTMADRGLIYFAHLAATSVGEGSVYIAPRDPAVPGSGLTVTSTLSGSVPADYIVFKNVKYSLAGYLANGNSEVSVPPIE